MEALATSPLSSLCSPPTSPYRPPADAENNISKDNVYNDAYPDMFEPQGERLTPQEKIEKVLHTLREVRWTFSQFLLAWVGLGDDLRD